MSVKEVTEQILALPVNSRGFAPEDGRTSVFQILKARPANRVCFDCTRRNPTWVCCTTGIFLCLDCSGKHRTMGTHISFVRSSDLDQFTPVQLMRLNLGGNAEARRSFGSQTDKVDFESPLVTRYNAALAASASAALGCSSPKVIDESSPVASFTTPASPSTPVSASFNGSSPKPAARRVNTVMKGSKLDDFDFDLDNFTFVPPKPQPTVQPAKQPTKPVDDLKVYDISAGQQKNPQSTIQLDSRFKAAKAISSADIYASSSTPPDLTFRADLASANAISSDMYFGRHQSTSTTDLDVQVQNVTEQGRQLVEAAAVEARILANRAFDWFQQNFI